MALECPSVWELLTLAVAVIKRPVEYAMSSKSFADDLRIAVRNLKNDAARVHVLEIEAKNNVRNFHVTFTDWKERAENNSREAQELLDAFDEESKTCCYGTLPDPICRYQFSRRAEGMIKVIKQLAENCSRFKELNDISFINPTPGYVVEPNTATASPSSALTSNEVSEDGAFESRSAIIRDIMGALADNSNGVVGVYGMGGVGKSTLLDYAERRIREEKGFGVIAKADVSQNPDIMSIQGEIADALGLGDIKNKESVGGRAKLLRERLEKEERNKTKVLIILDNLWEGLDLNKVGIPCGDDNKVMGCKLLLTSRDRDVLRRKMGCDKDFLLGGLNEDEAKRLFEKIVGNKVHDDEFKPLVNVALGKCAGVPFLIVATAKRFKDANLSEWKDTLKKMEKFKDREINDSIHHMLQWSYEKLEEEAKSLLRLCVVYGISKPSLENLVRYSIGLGLFQEVSSMEEARNRLSSHIRTLQASSLLLDSEDVDYFKIHDLVRDFIVADCMRNHPLLVLKDEVKSVMELLNDKPSNYMAICFPYVDMEELPQELVCPELRIFLLFTNNASLHVPDSLFNSTRKLMVLHLTGIHLTCLPLPFQFLENLHTLCLNGCSLENIAILGKLKGLEILSFVNSKIQRLPEEIGQLVKLRLLDLNNCSRLKIIEPGVLGSLINLEELYMENSFNQWNAGELPTPPTNASLVELNNMKKLCTLYVFIPDPSVLPKDLYVEKLTKYKIRIGNARRYSDCKGSSTLELKLNPIRNILQKECVQSILGKTDDLFLDGLDGIEQSICALSQKGFPNLKHLQVKGSPSVHYIHQSPSHVDFKKLDSLILENLISLEKLCPNHVPSKSFGALKVVRVESCPKMDVLFPVSVARELPQLVEIEVRDCQLMRGIVEADDCGKMELPNLRVLKLFNLPYIKNFFNSESAPLIGTSNNQVNTRIAFFNGQQVAFSRLETLAIDGLNNVEFLFSPSMIKSLVQLRDLQVSNCKKMEAIITEEEGLALEISETLAFPMLTNLELNDLESLMCFSCKKCSREAQSQEQIKSCSTALFSQEVAFSRLETLVIDGLNNVEFLFFPSTTKSFAQLRDLRVQYCKKMEAIVMEEEGLGLEASKTLAFPMLTELNLTNLESLKCFSIRTCSGGARSQDCVKSHSTALFNQEVAFPRLETLEIIGFHNLGFIFFPSMVKSFTQLKKLSVWLCEKMEAIIMEEEGLEMETSKTLAFPMLTDLQLCGLSSLTCFSRGKYSQEARSQDHVKSHSTTLFNGEIAFPNLERLDIDSMDNIEKIWHNQVAADSFHNLKFLCVDGCNKLLNLVPSCIQVRLLSLESLKASNCGSLEVVFERQPLNPLDRHPAASFPLKKLKLFALPELKCVWDNELHHQDKFQCLRSISISRCKSLTSLLPASIAKDLIQLEKLKIDECGIAELIEKEEGLVPRFVFPKLASLKLKHLTDLKCIYTGTHSLRWPALKTLEVHGCNKLEIFASPPENEIAFDKHPLFLIEKGTFPNLQELKLDLSQRMEIWHGHFHDEEFLCKLRVLELCHLSKESPISTYRFIESLTNLEELVICESYLEGPSSNQGAIEGTSIELKVILPFLGYIRHLQILHISHCDGLSNMFTPAIVTTLVALTKLRITDCRILTKVISDEEGEKGHVVAFNQLKYMELDGLTELRCFSSGGYTLMFPLLENVIVNGCPNMKFFSNGPIEAPKLERVQVDLKKLYGPTKYQYFWKGNLNITIHHMFEEMATLVGVMFMRLFEFPELIRKWHNELNPVKSSWQVKTLTVDKCPSFINAIPSKLMLALEQMTSLQVHNCQSLEEIFDLEGLDAVESTQVLPQLQYIVLVNLPKLRQLWNKDLQGLMCFNSLYSLTLYKCSNLRHAFVPLMARCLANLQQMELMECGQMEGVIVEEEGQGSAVEKITFSKLWGIQLKCLPNLTCFLLGENHTLDCPKMISLTIAHCPKMRSLTRHSSMDIDHGTLSLFTPQVQFPQLQSMVFSHMDNLSKIWTNGPQETRTFDNLWEVEVQNCKSLENLIPHWVASSLTQLEKLQVQSCGIEEIVTSGEDTPHSNTAQVLFPKLTSLVLHDMSQLQSFCPNMPTLNWPFLKELRVTHCDKLNMLSFSAFMNSWAQKDDQQDLSDEGAHSSFKRDFPNLQGLLLVDNNIQMIQDGNFPKDILGKPKALTLACFHDENAVFPSRFLIERFQNLQSLEVFCSSFEDIFPDEGLVDEEKHPMLENLRELKLNKLDNLKRVWREDSLVSKILQSVETFEVWDCPCLTTIFPAVTSFQNMTELVVKNCSGLFHLVTASAVTNLVHLTDMTIIGCEKMKEVVANDENEEGKVISLGKLERLRLEHLPSLECFSSTTSCSFKFPSMYRIEVEECPEMKIFSKGALSMPDLSCASLFRHVWDCNWEGDLNATIQKLSA